MTSSGSGSGSDTSSDETIFGDFGGNNMDTRSFKQKKEESLISLFSKNYNPNQKNVPLERKSYSPRTLLNKGTNKPNHGNTNPLNPNRRTPSMCPDSLDISGVSGVYLPQPIPSFADTIEAGIGTTLIYGKRSTTKNNNKEQKKHGEEAKSFINMLNQSSKNYNNSKKNIGLESGMYEMINNRETLDQAQLSPFVSVHFPKNKKLNQEQIMKHIETQQQKLQKEMEKEKEKEKEKIPLFLRNQMKIGEQQQQEEQNTIGLNSSDLIEKIKQENMQLQMEVEKKKSNIQKLMKIAHEQKLKISELTKKSLEN
ncbi:hypothetical protein M0813_08271 [Anaeramoeba flamelloides]|uniref:Uncharacterized protein n=1 Tax=Anaeramoeba flamelloides TaxID=1746091 RepID=A0ABQ8X802_9EUKA|nr:hypothetical protein M0813_08271 [Anaeramoeba flamelloides]